MAAADGMLPRHGHTCRPAMSSPCHLFSVASVCLRADLPYLWHEDSANCVAHILWHGRHVAVVA